jgi:hypothetical protein
MRNMVQCERRLNAHTLNTVPASSPKDHRLELTLSPPDGNHAAHWTAYTGSPDEGLIDDGGFHLADIR